MVSATVDLQMGKGSTDNHLYLTTYILLYVVLLRESQHLVHWLCINVRHDISKNGNGLKTSTTLIITTFITARCPLTGVPDWLCIHVRYNIMSRMVIV